MPPYTTYLPKQAAKCRWHYFVVYHTKLHDWRPFFYPHRLILYWEDSDSGKHLLNTASVFLTRTKYIREVKRYSCLATKQVRTPAAVYFPISNNHFLLWQEESGNSWAIGGELLQGQSPLLSLNGLYSGDITYTEVPKQWEQQHRQQSINPEKSKFSTRAFKITENVWCSFINLENSDHPKIITSDIFRLRLK